MQPPLSLSALQYSSTDAAERLQANGRMHVWATAVSASFFYEKQKTRNKKTIANQPGQDGPARSRACAEPPPTPPRSRGERPSPAASRAARGPAAAPPRGAPTPPAGRGRQERAARQTRKPPRNQGVTSRCARFLPDCDKKKKSSYVSCCVSAVVLLFILFFG